MKRKILIILLSMAILFTFMPLTAYAGQSGWYTDGSYYWYYDTVTGEPWTGWHKIDGY